MMMVLVKTDNHVEGSEQQSGEIESLIRSSLKRFSHRVTRIEAKLFDDNSREKDGQDDMRCVLEARPSGLQPLIVSHRAATVDQATTGAVDKLRKSLDRTLGRLNDRKSHASYGD